jgi:hypothetical protein
MRALWEAEVKEHVADPRKEFGFSSDSWAESAPRQIAGSLGCEGNHGWVSLLDAIYGHVVLINHTKLGAVPLRSLLILDIAFHVNANEG